MLRVLRFALVFILGFVASIVLRGPRPVTSIVKIPMCVPGGVGTFMSSNCPCLWQCVPDLAPISKSWESNKMSGPKNVDAHKLCGLICRFPLDDRCLSGLNFTICRLLCSTAVSWRTSGLLAIKFYCHKHRIRTFLFLTTLTIYDLWYRP